MANYSVAAGKIGAHAKTLEANVVDTVTFADDLGFVEVVSDGTAELYFTVDAPAPSVGDAAAHYMPASVCSRVVKSRQSGATVVRLISSGAVKYSVAREDA